jgi:uncharacterized membrane protein
MMHMFGGIPMSAITNIINNAQGQVQTVGGAILSILGAVALIVAGYKIVTGLISHGKKETNWFVVIILIIVGGALLASGFGLMQSISNFGEEAINELFQTITFSPGTLLPSWFPLTP